jgi:hypothetical protein
MRLVGVTGVCGDRRERHQARSELVEATHEASHAKYSLKRLGAKSHVAVKASSEVASANGYMARDLVNAGLVCSQLSCRLEHDRIRSTTGLSVSIDQALKRAAGCRRCPGVRQLPFERSRTGAPYRIESDTLGRELSWWATENMARHPGTQTQADMLGFGLHKVPHWADRRAYDDQTRPIPH